MNCCRVNLRSESWTYKSGSSILSNAFLSMATRALPHVILPSSIAFVASARLTV